MSPGVVKQSSTSSCCSALSWTGSESSHHSQPGPAGTPTHSLPYLPPPSYEKALQESHEAALRAQQQEQEEGEGEEMAALQRQHRLEDREDGYETLALQPQRAHRARLQRDASSSSSQDNNSVDIVDVPVQGPIILHKSSKALYRAVAAQWGITCKMNDHCRCLDCQSRYFDCDYDMNEEGKTDGGLGATSPIFLQEVMHGTACSIL
ncbi:uncharacterized protein LOC113208973 [Frankliniella occidentalis]|uniref:Uncharacterized protein LOC113208973 n=1 Tax=Frankliniella occidentalis TaxID=133901 RepID=A0A9C6WXI3_FRAOC|nr:uncharacterized protein LOC113208973 [Frankliniella occidentalis]XP_052120034.1 uncharacterized protein LOC113208973 [Frankliniella occidentalis]